MDRQYWIDRMGAATVMARAAATSEARLFHYELAGRCSIRAAFALDADMGSAGRSLVSLANLPPPCLSDGRLKSNDNERGHE